VVIQTMSLFASKFEVAENGGAPIGDILRGSPAENAGLKRGDVIQPPADRAKCRNCSAWWLYSPGTPVRLKIRRDRQEQQVALEIGELKDLEPKAEAVGSRFGLTLDAVTRELVKQFNLKTDEGVVITNVETGSPGARDGLRKGDVILEIERPR
jgi:serine protease Do